MVCNYVYSCKINSCLIILITLILYIAHMQYAWHLIKFIFVQLNHIYISQILYSTCVYVLRLECNYIFSYSIKRFQNCKQIVTLFN